MEVGRCYLRKAGGGGRFAKRRSQGAAQSLAPGAFSLGRVNLIPDRRLFFRVDHSLAQPPSDTLDRMMVGRAQQIFVTTPAGIHFPDEFAREFSRANLA